MKATQKPGVVFQPHVYQALQRGIRQMVGAVRPTLGPLGRGVAIDHLNNTNPLPEYVDDGGVIARRIIAIRDRDEDVGAMLARSMILRQHERVGDGTATAAVLFEAIFSAGVRYVTAGGNAMQLRRALENLTPTLLDALDEMTFRLEGQSALTQMALSLSHDPDIAPLMGEIFDLIGEFGRLEIRDGYGRFLHRDYVEGNTFEVNILADALLPPGENATLRLETPSFCVTDLHIEDHRDLFPLLKAAYDAQVNGLVIVAQGLSEKAVSLLVTHNNMNKFPVVAVRLPGLNPEDKAAALEDLSLLTGSMPYLKITGGKLEGIVAAHFGISRRFWVDRRGYGIVSGGGDPRRLRQHIHLLKSRYSRAEDVDARRKTQSRIGSLLGGSITLWIGGFTKPEIASRKALAERTALALRSSVQEGVVPGGGVAFLNCADRLRERLRTVEEPHQQAACRILIKALSEPARAIYHNAGHDPGEVFGLLAHCGPNTVFDAISRRTFDAREGGVLDSVSVLKASLRNAISTAALALTIDSVVHLAHPEMVGKPE